MEQQENAASLPLKAMHVSKMFKTRHPQMSPVLKKTGTCTCRRVLRCHILRLILMFWEFHCLSSKKALRGSKKPPRWSRNYSLIQNLSTAWSPNVYGRAEWAQREMWAGGCTVKVNKADPTAHKAAHLFNSWFEMLLRENCLLPVCQWLCSLGVCI